MNSDGDYAISVTNLNPPNGSLRLAGIIVNGVVVLVQGDTLNLEGGTSVTFQGIQSTTKVHLSDRDSSDCSISLFTSVRVQQDSVNTNIVVRFKVFLDECISTDAPSESPSEPPSDACTEHSSIRPLNMSTPELYATSNDADGYISAVALNGNAWAAIFRVDGTNFRVLKGQLDNDATEEIDLPTDPVYSNAAVGLAISTNGTVIYQVNPSELYELSEDGTQQVYGLSNDVSDFFDGDVSSTTVS